MLCLFKNKSQGEVLVITLYINLIYGIYMTESKSFKDKNLNFQDFNNEIIIAATFYWKILYTGIV